MVAIFADSNRARMRFIKSVDGWATTPASGRTRELRYTGSTITATKETTTSEEIRADRMVSDIVETSAKAAGEVNIEFSAGSHDDFLESFMMGAWTRPMTFDSVKGASLEWGTSAILYVKGKDVTDYFFAGRRVRTQGFKTPANNDYFQISAITFNSGANRTEITMTGATAVAEKGSTLTALYDANDVIVLKSVLRAGTAGASAFDSNGANAFAAAIAAGQLVAGQKVFIEGLGYEVGSVVVADGSTAPVTAGSKISVSDGAKTVVFQFGGVVPQTAVSVTPDVDEAITAANFAAAINAQRVAGALNCSATVATATVSIKNLNAVGGAIVELADVGAAFTVTNFAGGDTSLHGVFTVDTATDDVLSVSPAPSTFANASSLKVTVKGSMLRNPSQASDIVPQDYVIETGYEDVSQFFLADGQRVGAFSYDISANALVKGNFTFSGRAMSRFNATKLGDDDIYTVLGTTSTPIYNATVNVGAIELNGAPLSTAIQSITLSGDNSLRDQNAVGHKFPAGIGAGRMEIKGSVKAYFADGDLFDTFLEHKTVSLTFPLTDVEGHSYHFTVPAANFSTDGMNPAGGNQDIMEDMEFMAKRDGQTECQIQIDRFSCTLPVSA